MSGNPSLGLFLSTSDVNQASMLATLIAQQLSDIDLLIIRNVLKSNWEDEEQMVSNLLQNPFLIPEDLRVSYLLKGLEDDQSPYYILSAALGTQKIIFTKNDKTDILKHLRTALFYDIGAVSTRAFIALHSYVKYPDDVELFYDILKLKKSPLHDSALSWLVLQVKDKKELTTLLQDSGIDRTLIHVAEEKMDEHCKSLAHGETSPISIEVFSYIPDLNSFNAMLDKEDTLADFFKDLDTDKDAKLSAEEVLSFLNDISKDEVLLDEVKKEMEEYELDKNGKINEDNFIEMMFPKFQHLKIS